MRTIFLSLMCSCMAYISGAQNNPIFYGGPGDGHSTGSDLQASVNINDGGNGDGFASGGFLPAFTNVNKGGNGDGFSISDFLPVVTNHNAGGNGDGWMVSGYLPPVLNINGGGNGDGWSFDHNTPYVSGIYIGGIGDGWSSTYTAVLPLPISFLKFDAVKQEQTSRLKWEMAKDDDVAYFDIERSADAVNFGIIGKQDQDPSAKLKYYYTDEHPLQGKNYYRINIHAKNGTTVYTPTRVVTFDDMESRSPLLVYPIPAYDFITVEFPAAYLGHNTALNIFNAAGVMVRQMKLMPLKGLKLDTNISDLTPGNYFIHVISDQGSASVRIVKLSK